MTEPDAIVSESNSLRPMASRNSSGQLHRGSLNPLLWQYFYLQVLDFLTTIAFLVNGVREGNPLVRLALNLGSNPIGSLLAVKFLAVLLGLYCWRVGKRQLLSRINLLFALLVAWNLVALIVSSVRN